MAEMRIHFQHGADAMVIDLANRVLRFDPDNVSALQKRASAFVNSVPEATTEEESGRLSDRALGDVARIIELRSESRWPHNLHGFVLSKLGREEEAAAAHARADAVQGERTPDDLYWEAHVAYAEGDNAKAVTLFTELMIERPANHDAPYFRGRAHQRLGQSDQALEAYRLAVGLDPDGFIGLYALGELLTQQGRLDEGLGYLNRAREIEPEQPYAYEALADNFMNQGYAKLEEGAAEEALEQFERATDDARRSLELQAELPWSMINLGASLMERYRLTGEDVLVDEAVEQYTSALELLEVTERYPGAYEVALLNQCDALLQLDRAEQALPVCRQVVERSDTDPTAYYNLAGAYALLGRENEAFAALERDFELGDRDWGWLEQDRWFDGVRDDDRYRDLIARMRSETP
jgi:tetratricopeptide (TPR) repeat protein